MRYIISAFLITLFLLQGASASTLNADVYSDMAGKSGDLADGAGFDESADAATVIATVIKVFLSILGIIFIILVIRAGYKYMTAEGDEGKVEEALDTIKRAVVGLIIIVSAYAITAFVFKNMPSSAGGTVSETGNMTGSN